MEVGAADHAFTAVDGEWQADAVVIIAAPDAAAIRDLLESDDYAPLRAIRQASSRSHAVVVSGRGRHAVG